MPLASTIPVNHLLRRARPSPRWSALAGRLALSTSRIDGVIRLNAAQITKLREYRQALISAAVTGKLALPQEVAP